MPPSVMVSKKLPPTRRTLCRHPPASQPGLRRKPQRLAPKTDEILAQLHAHHGLLAPAAKALGLSRSNLDRMVQRRSRLAHACRQSRETLVDFTEGKLFECISGKREKSIIFALSTLDRHRGWHWRRGPSSALATSLEFNNFRITFVTPESVRAERAGQTIDHQPVEDMRSEDDDKPD